MYEGLIHSVSPSSFEDFVKRWTLASDKFDVIKKDGKIQLNFHENLSEKELKNLSSFVNNLGWFISAYVVDDVKLKWEKFELEDFLRECSNKRLYSFQLEAKFDSEFDVGSFKLLYHVTPSVNDKKIQNIGLSPRSLSKISFHPERVYFSRTEEDLDFLSDQFHKYDPKITEFSYYEIDIGGAIQNNSNIRLFSDPNFRDAVYTLSNIHLQFIKFITKKVIES